MSLNLDTIKCGDLLVCNTSSKINGLEAGVLIGKFLVIGKGSYEGDNYYKDDYSVITLHIIYRNPLGHPLGHKVGTTFDIPFEFLNHETYSWKLDYRPEEII